MQLSEIDEWHADYIISVHVADREIHTIVVVTWKRKGILINDFHKPRIASLLRHRRSIAVVDT